MTKLNDLNRLNGYCLKAEFFTNNGFEMYRIVKIADNGHKETVRTFFSQEKVLTELELMIRAAKKDQPRYDILDEVEL